MIEFKLAAFLLAKASVTALVGQNITAERTSQGVTSTRIVYRKTGGEGGYNTEGASGIATATVVLTFHANKGGVVDTAVAVYEAVRNQIDGFSGVMGGVEVERCVIGPYAYGSANPTQGDDLGCPAVNAAVDIIFHQALPTGVS